MSDFEIMKFQTNADGDDRVLIYNEDQSFHTITEPEIGRLLTDALKMEPVLGKVFAEAKHTASGELLIGGRLPDPGW